MSVATIHASAVLRRRAIAEDRLGGGGADDDDAYWASPPRLYDFSKHQPKDELAQEQPLPPPPPPSPKPEPPPASSPPSPSLAPRAPAPSPPSPTPSDAHLCLLALQGTGVSWGVRKRVHYVGRHRAARRADAAPAQPPAQSAVAAAVDEESSSNVKARSDPEPKAEADASERSKEEVAVEKKKKRRRKPGRGFTFRPRKRARRERKPPAPKAEPAAPPRAVADRSVAQVYAATEAGEGERKAGRRTAEKRKGKGDRRRGVAKRPRKALPKEEEEERCRDERKAVVVVKTETERRKSRREEERSGRDERKAAVVVKTKRKKSQREEEEASRDERKAVAVKTERRTRRRKEEEPEPETEAKPAPNNMLVKVEEPGGKGRAMVDRWTAQRYATAEASLLSTVRSMGARAGKPVQRRQLWEEARKRIGDTGLLDHLLKHTKDKVTPGGAERLRRRHNADGAMEYWLEPAGLAPLRREAGVADPYWVPPPGWKLGDPVSPDACALVMKRQVEELATELAEVKRHMEKLIKAHPGTLSKEVKSEAVKAYISHEPYQEKNDCMVKANGNLEKQVLSLEEKYASAARANDKLEEEVLFLKEKYEAVVEKNNRLEEQMVALSSSFLSLKDELLFLNDDGEQQLQLMEADQAEHHLYLCAKESCEADKQESNAGGEALDDAAALAVAGDGTTSSGGGGKRRSRKCSVRICKPQGAFQWPDAAHPSSPLTPTAAGAAEEELLDEYMADGGLELPPTPPSASSTNASSSKLLLLPAPDSPVQPPPPLPPASATCGPRDVDLQAAAQPDPGPELQLRHTAQDASSLQLPCGATASVGTELALATPTY